MARVKKLLNMVRGCGIRGRLGCGAASIGYRRRIRKRFVHSRCHPAVTESLSSNKLTMELDARWGTPGCGARQKAVGPTSTSRSSDEHPCILRRLIAREPAAIRNRCHAAPGQTATHRRHGRACPGHPRLANVVVKFIPDEHFQPIPGRKAFDESCAMLECATRKIGRYPDIQRAVSSVGYDIDPARLHGGRI
jgi:hypothetical protein